MILDDWQNKVLEATGNICVRAGRQTGKSTIISIKAAEFAVTNKDKQILVVSATERQAYLLFSKVLNYLFDNHKSFLKSGKDRPTRSEIKLKNGSIIRCLPTGLDGLGIRGYTTHMLIADEAHFIPEDVWDAITPQLTTTEAIQILISTTHGREGYFAKCFNNPKFQNFHVTTEEVANIRPEPQRTFMLEHLKEEKKNKTTLQFAQEYCAEFVEDLRQFFRTDIIKSCMTLSRGFSPISTGENFLGVDIARMGEDETVLFSVSRKDGERLRQIDMEVTEKTYLTETIARIKNADKKYNYKKIYLDDGGIGSGVLDPLLVDPQTKRKVVGVNNSKRSLDVSDTPQKKKTIKEDLYANLLCLMEQGLIEIFNEPEIMLSLKSVQYEYLKNGELRIFGEHNTHIAEALVRAAWCMKDKSLKIWARYGNYGI